MSHTPFNLRVNDCTNPVGVTKRPYFGWHIQDPRPNQSQTYYQLLVATSQADLAAGDMWDSGRVAGDTQNHIIYQGRPLHANTRYYWTVHTWDFDEQPGTHTEVGTFVTSILSNEDWAGAHTSTSHHLRRFRLPNM